MIRTVTLDKLVGHPPPPYLSWSEDAIKKWLIMVAKINPSEPYETMVNIDDTITFKQEQGAPAIRIYQTP